MGPAAVVVLDVLVDHGVEVTSAQDEQAIKALSPDGSDEALGKRIGTR
jgi:hypothetical protein